MTYRMPPRQWEAKAELTPHPPPEVPCRPANEPEIPKAARSLALTAQEHGWVVKITYVRGAKMHKTGRPGGVVDSIAVRMGKPTRRAYAIWYDGKRECNAILVVGQWPRSVKSDELLAWVKS